MCSVRSSPSSKTASRGRSARSGWSIEPRRGGLRHPHQPPDDVADTLRYPALVTLVFDHLSPNARALARQSRRCSSWPVSCRRTSGLRCTLSSSGSASHSPSPAIRPRCRTAIERATAAASETRDRLATAAGGSADRHRVWMRRQRHRGSEHRRHRCRCLRGGRIREVIARMARMVESLRRATAGTVHVVPADGAGEGAGRARRPQGARAVLRGAADSAEPRGGLPIDNQRGQSRQRQRLRGGRSRAGYRSSARPVAPDARSVGAQQPGAAAFQAAASVR